MKKRRVLVVDDNPVIHEVFRSIIDPGSFEVESAPSGPEALAKVESSPFDVVFLDLRMPGMDGVAVLRELRRLSSEARIYTMTGFELPEKIEETLKKGAAGSLFKPFDIGEVTDILERGSVAMTKLPVRAGSRTLLLRTDLIACISADGTGVRVHTFDEEFECRLTLRDTEARLPKTRFFRCHRGYLVNLDMVKEVVRRDSGGLKLILEDNRESVVPVSRKNVRAVRERLGLV